MLQNVELTPNERKWLGKMLSQDFPYKKEIITQLNSANISREYASYYLIIKFKISTVKQFIPVNVRVPIEMRVYRKDHAPMQFLLHFVNGYISELEVFNADSSKIDVDIDLESCEVEILFYQ